MLAKQYCLKKKSDFAKVAKYGRKIHTSFFIFYIYSSNKKQKNPRFGIVISQKISKKATIRNRLRRWIKSDLFNYKDNIPPFDYMLIAKKQAVEKNHKEISLDLKKICYLKKKKQKRY